jgi:DivIVA domain-containing protein
MMLAPNEIRGHSFSQAPTGYAPEEVEAFLATVAEQMAHLTRERRKMRTRLAEFEEKVEVVTEKQKQLKRRRNQLDERAEQLDQKERRVEEARSKVSADRETLMRVVARLRGELNSQLDVLENLEGSSPSEDGASVSGSTGGFSSGDDDEESHVDALNSLFPERLEADSTASQDPAAQDDAVDDRDTAARQFEKIKEDLQKQEDAEQEIASQSVGTNTSSSEDGAAETVEEDEEVPTDELNRIMDVFANIESES